MTSDIDLLELLATLAAVGGLAGLLGLSLLERLLPILPSSVMLVAFGIGAGSGHWSYPAAVAVSAMGSVAGCLAIYHLGALLGEKRASGQFGGLVSLLGITEQRFESLRETIRARHWQIAFGSQLVPALRLITPGVAGLMQTDLREFMTAVVPGVVLWNLTFISIGVFATPTVAELGASSVVISASLAAFTVVVVWWLQRQRRTIKGKRCLSSVPASRDHWLFLRSFLLEPSRIGAIAPSGSSLAQLITSQTLKNSGPVIELGPGTGVFTQALVVRGVPESHLILIEQNGAFADMLRERFPAARVLVMNAARLQCLELVDGRKAGSAISGLPLRSMSSRHIMAILGATFENLQPDAGLYQFTYGLRCPVPRPILDRLGLKASRLGMTLANLPPASVYCIRRRGSKRVTI